MYWYDEVGGSASLLWRTACTALRHPKDLDHSLRRQATISFFANTVVMVTMVLFAHDNFNQVKHVVCFRYNGIGMDFHFFVTLYAYSDGADGMFPHLNYSSNKFCCAERT